MKGLKGNIIFTSSAEKFEIYENSYLVESHGKVYGIYKELPFNLKEIEIQDFGKSLIIPGFVDMHFHAPQFQNIGLGLDEELLEWLEKYTFPEEAKYSDSEYSKRLYTNLAKQLWRNGTTRVVLFSSIHTSGTKILMDILDRAGIGAYVGKVNMDRNSPDFYVESTEESLTATEEWILETKDKYQLVKPIITPRFVPTCSEKLMKGLANLAKKYNLKIQSHLSENEGEIEWVKDLHPEFDSYGEVYDGMGLLNENTIMAHTVHSPEDEIELLAKRKAFSAHCPNANYNLSSGIMPVRKFLDAGVKVGLGSDVGAGHQIGMYKVMSQAVQASKMKWFEGGKVGKCLSTSEVFYMGTKGGGEFFGKVGSFEKGYDFDALVIGDEDLGETDFRSVEERLQRFIYCGDDRNIIKRYVAGKLLSEPTTEREVAAAL
ncbi:guanine deaminase [Clostridium sp. PL3]|uniref:Guanine deaminase n=1 Tax=Clostridium thailandense TaxID=2794346 RepID=A0A949TJS6_9CLOT|nr:guanine deaminase [Clostridium thailandense]MBV7274134.1 guanine deaminase [Clostridium thailandense]